MVFLLNAVMRSLKIDAKARTEQWQIGSSYTNLLALSSFDSTLTGTLRNPSCFFKFLTSDRATAMRLA